jgi:acetyl esterase
MPLDPQAQALLEQMAAMGAPPIDQMSVDDARQMILGMAQLAGPPEEVAKVEDRTVPVTGGEIPVRVYTPSGSGPFPVLVYYHGGGWVIGNRDSVDAPCRSLANSAQCVVVSVDYRLAPEHKFPTAAEDCYDATRWVAEHAGELAVDAGRIAVGGDSAGGNLAAVVALMARDRGGPKLAFQLLVYPVTDYSWETPSYTENAEGFMLTKQSMVWFWNHYVASETDATHMHASPLRAESLTGLPPALVITAEFDPLRDEGEAYAERLKQAGVPVQATRYPGMIHGFFQMSGVLDQGKKAIDQAADALRGAFATPSTVAR